MKFCKGLLLGVFVGCLLGIVVGVNFSQDRTLLSNPFDSPVVKEKVISKWKNAMTFL